MTDWQLLLAFMESLSQKAHDNILHDKEIEQFCRGEISAYEVVREFIELLHPEP